VVMGSDHSFKTRPDGLTRDPTDSGPEPGRVEEKRGKKKLGVTWLTRSNQVTRSKPGTRALDRAGS
jgi:hypothetical protein